MKNAGKRYLAWVKKYPCIACGSSESEPHHLRSQALGAGMGLKVADVFAIPVCRACHQECHALNYSREDQFRWTLMTIKRAINDGVIQLFPS